MNCSKILTSLSSHVSKREEGNKESSNIDEEAKEAECECH